MNTQNLHKQHIAATAACVAERLRILLPPGEQAGDEMNDALADMITLAAEPDAFCYDASAENAIMMAVEHTAEWTPDGYEDPTCAEALASLMEEC